MVNLALQYLRLATRRNNLKLDIWFIQQCLKFKVFPTFSIVRTSKNVPPNIRTSLQIKLMKKEICSHYSKLNYINCKLKYSQDIKKCTTQHQDFTTDKTYEKRDMFTL
ncbi:uncharacterized protein LOC126884124 [Diabrotica virgifera virgifera]|uniref:Uncharacterized protein n=1 Tax=Diabrotica virgifera virgifera TaxID=50390 RepID=A0ABM5K6W3_DIAVI|nr:uncharacterized protein LOC126884124 [Diabrotica virgifera virgifera]